MPAQGSFNPGYSWVKRRKTLKVFGREELFQSSRDWRMTDPRVEATLGYQ